MMPPGLSDAYRSLFGQMNQTANIDPFNRSATVPIPGLTGPTTPMTGMAPPNQQLPNPGIPQAPMNPQPFMSNGPYGQQAAQLAGLLGQSQIPTQPIGPQAQGLLGSGKGFRIPGGK